MPILIACYGNNAAENAHVNKIALQSCWEEIFIIHDKSHSFDNSFKCTDIPLDFSLTIPELVKVIQSKLPDSLFGDVGINIVAGSGKLHTAVLGALLKSGCGLRFVSWLNNQIIEI